MSKQTHAIELEPKANFGFGASADDSIDARSKSGSGGGGCCCCCCCCCCCAGGASDIIEVQE